MSRGLLIALLVVIIGALIAIPLIVVRRSRPGQTPTPVAAEPRPRLSAPAREPAAPAGQEPVSSPQEGTAADTLNGVAGQVNASALRTIRDRVEADPAEAARVLRRWLNEDR